MPYLCSRAIKTNLLPSLLRSVFAVLFLAAGIIGFATYAAHAGQYRVVEHPLERNGIQLFLQSISPAAGAMPEKQILFAHGVAFSSHPFDVDYKDYSLARFLADHGYTVWLLDIAGFGRSGKVADGFMPNADYAAQDLNAAADMVLSLSKAKKLHLFGWSWGTVTASRFAARHPEKLRSLTLCAPILHGLGLMSVTEPFVTQEVWPHAYKDFRLLPNGAVDPQFAESEVVRLYTAGVKRYDNHPIPNGGRREVFGPKDGPLIPAGKLELPVLYIWGAQDKFMDAPALRRAIAATPGAVRVEVLPDAGHALFLERPSHERFHNILLEFLEAH
ncbi:Pimeloyl-ACP methyl ester carboxylesterase [Desulfovibrio legallii]|uniref:Pimeloyl-ACP methyl ester carboxylesterase n=2 Tax=Desulfovibrio legallii TaxID=571438 RepID=A0A1G7KJC0_9BACT|nr:Pimeloyl-ACP methyl ester carboxylesterase [Desulfovibrio legallii]